MRVQKIFWEIQQNFEKIRLLCIKKCAMISKAQREQIAFFERIVEYCTVIFLEIERTCIMESNKQKKYDELAEKGYLQGISFRKMQEDIRKIAMEEECYLKNKECVEDAYQKGYKAMSIFMTDAVDYSLYEERTKFSEWVHGQNPYTDLQNIGKEIRHKELSLEDTAVLFRDILSVLSEKKTADETIKDLKIKLKNCGGDICCDFFGNI